MNPDVVAWVREAPFEDTFRQGGPAPFSYEAWFARGRALPNATGTLAGLLEREDLLHPSGDGRRVAYALGWIGTRGDARAIAALRRGLGSRDVALRMEAAQALGHLGDAAVLPTLAALLRDTREDANVRANAAIGLGRTGLAAADPVLRSVLTDGNGFVVASAREGLRLLHAAGAP
jgi:HEAT repeat protein